MFANGEDARPAKGAVREVHSAAVAATLEYSPDLDGLADPGEIVWAWVPFEEDPERGKDRPLLVVGRHHRSLLGLMLSSKEPDDREADDWLDLGSGAWDRDGRHSYLRLDRVFELDEHDIRREGSVLESERFDQVSAVLRVRHGWN
ncbi:type II toxin-antitoxin system PemK/MazF family toxin [Umezawaea tangerina]|uniref:PemK-like, MazF-like toxin of type II toxin-antitoxin system n=1 Tax=Umezawaea tangerina TaxID=84725 RepID=A0A2T0SRY0_9PSEU|nr:type II toxin-antitoxin system PemK/MazF family toxin [Umezawaea tangerina]PRY36175.1 PemK-like, MazF-like toxin of type II toxin-antitoxin system [Umezawaea tangerina]